MYTPLNVRDPTIAIVFHLTKTGCKKRKLPKNNMIVVQSYREYLTPKLYIINFLVTTIQIKVK